MKTIKNGTAAGESTLPFLATMRQHTMHEYNIFIQGEIVDVADFTEAISALSMANEEDVVIINLNSGGGNVYATDTLVEAMNTCRGKVVVKGSGIIASAACTILLAAEEFSLSPNTVIMFHTFSYGVGGNVNQTKAQADFFDKHLRRMMQEELAGLFTEEEINEMHKGAEYWMDAEEFVERVGRQQEWLENKHKEEEKQARKQQQQLKRAIRNSLTESV